MVQTKQSKRRTLAQQDSTMALSQNVNRAAMMGEAGDCDLFSAGIWLGRETDKRAGTTQHDDRT